MESTRKCEGCIWFDQCGDAEACDMYTPCSSAEDVEVAEEEYARDLDNRHDLYIAHIDEQDS